MHMNVGIRAALCVLGVGLLLSPAGGTEIVYVDPGADGTILDGGINYDFDGIPDEADWTFNHTSYEGTIELSSGAEFRLVWEYDLSVVSLEPPVSAMLTFTIRTAALWPRDVFDVLIYSYPADLDQHLDDFLSEPVVLQGAAPVPPWEGGSNPTPTVVHSIDVSDVVNEALSSGADMVAFRFQVDPGTPINLAFIDAEDGNDNQDTKPYLVIDEAQSVPGDADGDLDVDLYDYASFWACLEGPGVAAATGCEVFDFDSDTDVDLDDAADFANVFTGSIG